MNNPEQYINSSKPVLVEFVTSWSESCKKMEPVLREVRTVVGAKAGIVTVDIEEFSQWIEDYSVFHVPTFIIFKDGNVVWRKTGNAHAAEILQHLSPVMT